MNKIVDNKLYIRTTLLLCVLTYLLNFCTAIYQCGLIFTFIAITTNATTFIYDKSKSLKALAVAILISFALLQQLPYYIDGKIVNGLVFVSFSSLMISMYCTALVFEKLSITLNFIMSNALSISLAAIIDGFIMALFFLTKKEFSYTRVLDIFNKEVSYKIMYLLVASVIISMALNVLKNNTNLNNNLKINN